MFKPVKCGLVAMAALSTLTARADALSSSPLGGSVEALLAFARQQSPEVIALQTPRNQIRFLIAITLALTAVVAVATWWSARPSRTSTT